VTGVISAFDEDESLADADVAADKRGTVDGVITSLESKNVLVPLESKNNLRAGPHD
jgi:hypothetical protein